MTGLSCNSSVVGITFSFILASYVAIAQLLFACKSGFLGGGIGHISTSIGSFYAERVFFAIFTHFIVIYRLLQFSRFKFSDEEKMHANINSLWYSEFSYEMHSHLDFLERLFLPSSGFTLVEVAVRNKIKQRKWRGNVLPS